MTIWYPNVSRSFEKGVVTPLCLKSEKKHDWHTPTLFDSFVGMESEMLSLSLSRVRPKTRATVAEILYKMTGRERLKKLTLLRASFSHPTNAY